VVFVALDIKGYLLQVDSPVLVDCWIQGSVIVAVLLVKLLRILPAFVHGFLPWILL